MKTRKRIKIIILLYVFLNPCSDSFTESDVLVVSRDFNMFTMMVLVLNCSIVGQKMNLSSLFEMT